MTRDRKWFDAWWQRGFVGVCVLSWQVDYRRDGWLPLFVRHGKEGWHILPLGRYGCATLSRRRAIKPAPVDENGCRIVLDTKAECSYCETHRKPVLFGESDTAHLAEVTP